jgi:asparagine synthase (glutamine-hydrolysing)
MCGITGITVFEEDVVLCRRRLEAMCATLAHRGPDDFGMEINGKVAMGIRRLAVIDPPGGKQPMHNEDGSVRTVCNGEIYNFRQLRKNLETWGHVFKTRSDTEVIVHAYEHYGDAFPEYLNGMFAIALYDLSRKQFFLVRDHAGIKPLYYSISDKAVVWGSEIKSLLASGMVPRDLDIDALAEFLAWEYVPGSRTLFKTINKLLPGQMIKIDLQKQTHNFYTYWDVPRQKHGSFKSADQWADAVDEKIRESVGRQMVSDVPLGAFLSGGVDSSLIVAHMGHAATFSIGFDDPGYNELKWARKVASHLGTHHEDAVIHPEIIGLFDHLMEFMDDPIADNSIFPTYLVSRHARDHVTVVLSGDGGDELFGGYETYAAERLAEKYQWLPALIRRGIIEPAVGLLGPRREKKGIINKALRFVDGFQHPRNLSHARWRIFAGDAMRKVLFTPEARNLIVTPAGKHITDLLAAAGDRDTVNRSLYVDFKSYLCDNCLVKIDRMSMAVSLESRVPFLDREMVELAFQIPGDLKLQGSQTKALLKKVAARRIPRDCVYRPKEGFSMPVKNWLKDRMRPLMEELLDENIIKKQGIFNASVIADLKHLHLDNQANNAHILWGLMIFQAWRRRWLEG